MNIHDISFSLHHAALITDEGLFVFDLQTKDCLCHRLFNSEITTVEWSPSGNLLAIGSFEEIVIIDTNVGSCPVLRRWLRESKAIAWIDDNLLFSSTDSSLRTIYEEGEVVRSISETGIVLCDVRSPEVYQVGDYAAESMAFSEGCLWAIVNKSVVFDTNDGLYVFGQKKVSNVCAKVLTREPLVGWRRRFNPTHFTKAANGHTYFTDEYVVYQLRGTKVIEIGPCEGRFDIAPNGAFYEWRDNQVLLRSDLHTK